MPDYAQDNVGNKIYAGGNAVAAPNIEFLFLLALAHGEMLGK